jgi:hypothetical protein
MGKTVERRSPASDDEKATSHPMTWEEFMASLQKLPQRLLPETSASIIRELRGPLPDDDPDFLNAERH